MELQGLSFRPGAGKTLLQATIGGVAEDFDVVPLSDRVFRFSVSSRWVGFHIFKLRSFECNLFKVFFHLWGNGGPRWISEWKAYCKEEASSWSSAASGRSKPAQVFTRSKASYAEVVKSNPLTGANAIPVKNQAPRKSAFDRLIFFFWRSFIQLTRLIKEKMWLVSLIKQDPLWLGQAQIQILVNGGAKQSLGRTTHPRFCSRCLSESHSRWDCKSVIRCLACKRGGHIAANCPSQSNPIGKEPKVTVPLNEKNLSAQPSRITSETADELGPSPPVF